MTRLLPLIGLLGPSMIACSDYGHRLVQEPVPVSQAPLMDVVPGSSWENECRCPEGFVTSGDGQNCTYTMLEPATPAGDLVEVCPIERFSGYGMHGARFPGGMEVRSPFWGDGSGAGTGRLNDVGVWGCEASTGLAGAYPLQEWVGFTVCLELEEPGDFLLGYAGDNRVRMNLNGVRYFEQTDDDMNNFRYWHLRTMSLEPGMHRLDIEGYNTDYIAAFGAEIAGPFPQYSLVDDAAMADANYADNIVWSTSDAIGNAFPVGESVSWTCPDGSTLKGCEEPVCERVVETPCL